MIKAKGLSTVKSTKRGKKLQIDDVIVVIPLSTCVSAIELTTNVGTFNFDENTSICTWKIGKMTVDKQPLLQGRLILDPDAIPEGELTTIQVKFKIPDASISGIQVDSLSLTGEKYKPYKGVRAVTKGGNYEIRS